jgi:hypothetical protein
VLEIRQVLTLRRRRALQRFEIDVQLAGEAEAGVGRVPFRVEGRGHRRTHDRVVAVFLTIDEFRLTRGQPSRRGEHLDVRLRRQRLFIEPRLQALGQLYRERRQPGCRHLLDADFNQ